MTHRKGIVSALGPELTLQERLIAKLEAVPSDTAYSQEFADKNDRQNVRHRALISAALDAIFEHGFGDVLPDAKEVELGTTGLTDLMAARRAWLHDTKRLNNGYGAQQVAKPASKESVESSAQIPARRETLILWLAVIDLWEKSNPTPFRSKQELREAAAKALGSTPNALKTELSNLKNGKSRNVAEISLFNVYKKDAQEAAAIGDSTETPFDLLITAVRAISETAKQ